jgi:Tol biopolymer transport system component
VAINSDATGVHKLFSYLFARGVSLSPNQEKIAFWGDFDETKEAQNLYAYDITNNEVRLLQKDATYSGTAFPPSWSSDSRKLAYASIDGYITILDIENMSVRKIIKGDAPSWSPDGKSIIYREGISYFERLQDGKTTRYYIKGHKYYCISSNGEGRKFILDGGSRMWEFTGNAYAPVVWSRDSKYLLFFRPYDSWTKGPNRSKVYVMDIEQNRQIFVKDHAGIPSFSWGKE